MATWQLKAEGSVVWEEWAKRTGLKHAFVVTRQNADLLSEHLAQHPAADIILLTQLQELPRRIRSQYPAAQLWVSAMAAKSFVQLSAPEITDIKVIPLRELFSDVNAIAPRKPEHLLILAENHALGGLNLGLLIGLELKRLGWTGELWERTVPVPSASTPVRDWELHSFATDWLDYALEWRRRCGVKQADAELPAATGALWLPLHMAPTLSPNPAWALASGLKVVTWRDPWGEELASEFPGALLLERAWSENFDPFRKPGESPVNQGIARGVARIIATQWGLP